MALSVVRDPIGLLQADSGLDRAGIIQPVGRTLRPLSQVFEARREENQQPDNAWRVAEGGPVTTVLADQNNAGVGPYSSADALDSATALYAQLRNRDQRRVTPQLRRNRQPSPQPVPRAQQPVQRTPQLQVSPLATQDVPQFDRERYPPPGIFSPPPPSGPPEEGGTPIRQFGMQPIGPRAGGAEGRLLRSFADRIAWAEHAEEYQATSGTGPVATAKTDPGWWNGFGSSPESIGGTRA